MLKAMDATLVYKHDIYVYIYTYIYIYIYIKRKECGDTVANYK